MFSGFFFRWKANVTKTDLAVKYAKVMIYTNYNGQDTQCYIPSFIEIGPPVPEKKIFFN